MNKFPSDIHTTNLLLLIFVTFTITSISCILSNVKVHTFIDQIILKSLFSFLLFTFFIGVGGV